MTIKQLGGVFGRNPTFNDVTIEGQLTFDGDIDINSDLKVNGDLDVTGEGLFDGNVGINTDSPSSPSGKCLTVYDTSFPRINLKNSTTGDGATDGMEFYINGANAYIQNREVGTIGFGTSNVIHMTLNTTGNLAFGSGKGIDFSATAGTGTSELLDDYEEGVWTPTVSGSSTAGTYEASASTGRYTKVGDAILLDFDFNFASSITGGGSGYLSIGGAPFTFGRSTIGSIKLHNITFTADFVTLNAANGSTILYMSQVSSGSGEVDLPISSAVANGRISGTIISYV